MMEHGDEPVLILDFGSQVTQLIARRIRESGVYCQIHPFYMPEKAIRDFDPVAVVIHAWLRPLQPPAKRTLRHAGVRANRLRQRQACQARAHIRKVRMRKGGRHAT